MAKRLLLLGVLAMTQAWIYSQTRKRREAGATSGTNLPRHPVQTWEGEGGALPTTGAQLGPDPTIMPADRPADRMTG